MKKLLTITLAIAMVFGVALTAQAINTVQMTLTSPAITKTGCEKVGSMTFGFDAGSQINQGDWWYMDLPTGTVICNTIDYVLVGNAAFEDTVTGNVTLTDATDLEADLGANVSGVGTNSVLVGQNLTAGQTDGPYSLTDISAAAGANLTLAGNIALHVYAPKNGRRVWMYAYGEPAGAASILVPAGTQFNISILDGNAYNDGALATWLLLDRGAAGVTGDDSYGNSEDDVIDLTENVPHVENTLCVNAEDMSGDLMFTSFFSENNKFTFTGDSQIAHVAAANPLALAFCKGDTTEYIEIGGQNSCSFVFEDGSGYCGTSFEQQLMIQGVSTFGDIGDRYDISVASNTAGVYFNGDPSVVGFEPDEDPCNDPGAAVAAAWVRYLSSGNVATGVPGTSCSVSANNRIVRVNTENGFITGIQMYDTLFVDLPAMAYDTSIIGNGVEADITITLSKYPCGVIFEGTHTLGTFVTTCPTSTATETTLLFPWFPPMDGSLAPWWGGFVIVNAGLTSGTVELVFWEVDGDHGTLTTGSLDTGEQYNPGALSNLIDQITPDAANTGDMGDANFAITATCNFAGAGGFAFTGNGIEATGYTAYVGSGGAWQ